MEELVIPDINKTYKTCAEKAKACLQKIDAISSKLNKLTRRQKDIESEKMVKLYSAIRKEVEYIKQVRGLLAPDKQFEFDVFISEKAATRASENPEVYFAKRVAEAIAQEEALSGMKNRRQ